MDVKKHYRGYHNVDQNNQIFIKVFKKQNNVFHGKKCLRCNDFLPRSRFKVNHDFLSHYNDDKNAFEEKSVNYTNLGYIQKCEITCAEYCHDYDFFNS